MMKNMEQMKAKRWTKKWLASCLSLAVLLAVSMTGCASASNRIDFAGAEETLASQAAGTVAAGKGGAVADAFHYEAKAAQREDTTKASPLSGDTAGVDAQFITSPLYRLSETAAVGAAPGAVEDVKAAAEDSLKTEETARSSEAETTEAGTTAAETSAVIPTAASIHVQNYDGSTTPVVPEPTTPLERVVWNSCKIEGDEVVLRASMTGSFTPSNTKMGEDTNFYLLQLEPFEDDIAGHRYTAMLPKNAEDLTFRLPLNNGKPDSRLFDKFVLCIWDGSKYIAVSDFVYINNPEVVAKYQEQYQEPMSKKGLLIELTQIADAFELGVHNVIVNIPFNVLFGEGIDYEYEGETYHFNKTVVETYDKTISMFSNKQMNVTAILLNGWNASTPDFYYPGTAQASAETAAYYHFNTRTEQGYKDLKAIGSFLADRYSGRNPNHGRVSNWIIGNEVNNQFWNYIGAMDLNSYTAEFARTFRVFYNAIKSTSANDRVFFSVDYNWMREANGTTKYNARDFLDTFAAKVRTEGNIDWGLAYHPYSYPMNEPEFWDDFNTGLVAYSETTPIVNIANLAVLTNYMQRSELRDRNGSVRHIILSEEGFTSQSASRGTVEELQAAAFAYAYYIVDSNPYIDAFILSRQIDAPSEAANSMAFGLWTTDATADVNIQPAKRKYIWPVFKNIDNQQYTLEVSAFAKKILGIQKWSDVIPNFKWARFEQ